MTTLNLQKKLPKKFYQRELHTIAKELLGKIFVKIHDEKILAGKIVEVEAYDGRVDQASHSFNGKTKRNEVMFGGGGFLYVYFTYGMHFCANVVTGKLNEGTAILLRAIEPLEGVELMAMNRYGKTKISEKEKINLANGPGKICSAFAMARKENGTDLCSDSIFILNSKKIKPDEIAEVTRIGIKKSVDLPWRYYIKNNPFVSKK